MRIVADTNVLIASIFWNGIPYEIVKHALEGKCEIITSTYILSEVRNVLDKEFKLSIQEIDDVVNGILAYAAIIEPTSVRRVARDANDDMIISCALTSKADFIVTRDKDLLVLKEYKGILIKTPEEFLMSVKKALLK